MMFCDDKLPALAVVLDPARLSSTFNEPLRADNLRYKPGVSMVARVTGEETTSWVASYAHGHTAKLDKLRSRADSDGVTLCSKAVRGEHELVKGPIASDYKLRKPLRTVAAPETLLAPDTRVLNYNPHRRLVVSMQHHGQALVAKITASEAPVPIHLLDSLAADGVPVLPQIQPDGLRASRHVSYYPWHGQGNLKDSLQDGTAGTDSIHQAGAALAALHAHAITAGAHSGIPSTTAARATRKLTHMARDVSDLLPQLADQLRALAGRIISALPETEQQVLLHGDFSSDQVLGDFSGNPVSTAPLRIIDLDRWGVGPATSDLGSFVAAELTHPSALPQCDVLTAFLDGYGPVDGSAMNAWTAFHLYCRLAEPFRSCSPQWQEQIQDRLHHIDWLLP